MYHHMMTSSNGNIFRVTGPLCGEFTGHWWIPHHKGQGRGALMFSLLCAWTKRLSKQSRRWWFETRSHSLWRHCNEWILANHHPVGSRNLDVTLQDMRGGNCVLRMLCHCLMSINSLWSSDKDPGQHWLKLWLVTWRHQTITWANVGLSSVRPS